MKSASEHILDMKRSVAVSNLKNVLEKLGLHSVKPKHWMEQAIANMMANYGKPDTLMMSEESMKAFMEVMNDDEI